MFDRILTIALLCCAFLQCFQAGVICSNKCKCVSCSNHAGSQKLIDKRRKMKDQGGAEYAMKISKELWERPKSTRRAVAPQFLQRLPMASPGGLRSSRGASASVRFQSVEGPYPGEMHFPPHFASSSPQPHLPSSMPPPSYGHGSQLPSLPPHMRPMMPEMGLSSMGHGAPMTPVYGGPYGPIPPPSHQTRSRTATAPMPRSTGKRPAQQITPASLKSVDRKPGIRLDFDSAISRKKQQKSGREEQMTLFFGHEVPRQSTTTILNIFSFLSNRDIFRASLVCKDWSRMSMDPELWKFGGGN